MSQHAVQFWGPELDALRAVLGDAERAGAVVVGGPGAGKTTLVRTVLRGSGHAASLSLQCSASLADVAYGALSPFLTDLDEVQGPVDVLRAVQRRLDVLADPPSDEGASAAVRTHQRPVIIVEDCQFLDAASAFVLAQLGQNREAILLATSVGLRGESALTALVDTGLLATVTMPPLGMDQTRAMCESLVGGSPTEGAVRTVLGMTGGSPRLIAAFLASALDQGIVVRDRGPGRSAAPSAAWTLLRPAPSVDERLVDAVETMHAELTDEQQVAATMLALAGRMPRTLLRVVADDHGQGFADVHVTRSTDDGMIELSCPLYADVLRSTVPPGRSSLLLEQWQAAGGSALRPLPGRSVVWSLDNGLPASESDRLAAGYECLAAGDLAAAWSLAARTAPSDGPRLALLRGEVMLSSTRTWSGRADLVELADTLCDDHLLSEVLCVLAMDLVRCGPQSSPWEALGQVWSEYRDRACQQGRTALLATGPVATLLTALHQDEPASGRSELLALAADLLEAPQVHPAVRTIAHWLRMDGLSRTGRLGEAVREAALAHEEVARTPRMTAMMGGHAMVELAMALAFFGDPDPADQVLDDQRGRAAHRWHASSGTVQALQGFVDLLRGRMASGIRGLQDAGVDLAHADPAHLMPLVQALHALTTVPVVAPPAPADESALARIRADGRRGPQDRWLLASALASLADELAQAGTSEEISLWRRVLDDPALDRYPVVRREILFAAAFGRGPADDHDELVARLHQACSPLDGPRSSLIRKVCDPAVASDAVLLARVADDVRRSGDLALAAGVWARVVLLHNQSHDLRRRGEALRHLHDVVQALGGIPSRYVGEALHLAALTDREHEIVRLALDGLSNADIARVLVVSPRTVEGHLYRVFTKLGISERSELWDLGL
ncbi:regulatory protein, luxR family [Raineyella antarctica]|uniref:Regulatory protein, luxR family n=1 Tax=Raineyella antarctica TaxID=1577474 RepID=A0A1G6HGW6_9ACTN|nr:LuxR family transcriptional regulator [Raineyella antarctica]SDB93482.1 regulatory protein, luxR family [Raineyella antarctica]